MPPTLDQTRRFSSREARLRIASGQHRGPTTGLATEYAQANLVVVPALAADAFAEYCARNPASCPVIERLAPGSPDPVRSAPGADLRREVPRYRWYGPAGAMSEHSEIVELWREDAVAFLLGCSFTFEAALARVGLVPRHWEEGRNVPMFRSDRPTDPVEPFAGPLVVSMRPIPAPRIGEAYAITAQYPSAHGAPVHHGDPGALGIADLGQPDWGDPVTIRPGEVPAFWACGVTSQVAVAGALAKGAVPWAITHAPGHMFITDLGSGLADG